MTGFNQKIKVTHANPTLVMTDSYIVVFVIGDEAEQVEMVYTHQLIKAAERRGSRISIIFMEASPFFTPFSPHNDQFRRSRY